MTESEQSRHVTCLDSVNTGRLKNTGDAQTCPGQ